MVTSTSQTSQANPDLSRTSVASHPHHPASAGSDAVVGAGQGRSHVPASSSGVAAASPSVRTTSTTQAYPRSPPVASQQPNLHMLPTYRQASVSSTSVAGPSNVAPFTNPSSPSRRQLNASLPDILNSHLMPTVPPARPNQHRQNRDQQRSRSHPQSEAAAAASRIARHGHHGNRHRPRGESGGGAGGTSRGRTLSTSSTQTQEGSCKEPCVKCVVTFTSFRWVLVVLSVLGVCCVVSGIVLAALHAVGNSFLFLAIMFIGLGVLLVIVVAVGWKCTPRGHEPLHALFGIGQFQNGRPRERRHGHRRHRNRDGHWFGGVLYPEFQYRRPPPSYTASMQDYQNQSLQELSTHGALPSTTNNTGRDSFPSSPPPSYRSRTSTIHSGIHTTFPEGQDSDLPNSRPPTYRSRAPSRRPSLPRDNNREGGESECVDTPQPPTDVSFVDESGSPDNIPSPTNGVGVPVVSSSSTLAAVAVSSSSLSSYPSPQVPFQPPQITDNNVETASASHPRLADSQYSTTMQVYIVPSIGSSDTDQNLAQDPESSAQISDSPSGAMATSGSVQIFPHHCPSILQTTQSSTASAAVAPPSSGQVPSFHQRMKSEDLRTLEKALQSLDTLDSHMQQEEGEGGRINLGANFNDLENYDTHL